jgi:hypothetical protein
MAVRIFGEVMASWPNVIPAGIWLKSLPSAIQPGRAMGRADSHSYRQLAPSRTSYRGFPRIPQGSDSCFILSSGQTESSNRVVLVVAQ